MSVSREQFTMESSISPMQLYQGVNSSEKILLDIFATLQRLETRIETQGGRLNTIESSIRLGGTASLSDDSFSSSVAEKKLPDIPIGLEEPLTTAPECSPTAEYAASVAKLRRRFEFVDGTRSELVLALDSRDEKAPQLEDFPVFGADAALPETRVGQWVDDDVYSLSIYSTQLLHSRPLSRLDMDAETIPPLPLALVSAPKTAQMALNASDAEDKFKSVPYESAASVHTGLTAMSRNVAIPRSRSHGSAWSIKGFQKRFSEHSERSFSSTSLGSSHSSTTRPHQYAEMAFYAYDNIKHGVQSRILAREKHAAREETARLQCLGPVSQSDGRSILWKLLDRIINGVPVLSVRI